MKKLLSIALSLTCILGLMAGCTAVGNSSSSVSSEGKKPLKVALLIPGQLGDKSFLDAAFGSLEIIKNELGAETKYVEMGSDQSKWHGSFVDFCDKGYDLILTIGDAVDVSMHEVAVLYPTQKFINLDSQTKDVPANVYSMNPKAGEMSFLAGATAALKAKELGKTTIGFIGGMDAPMINEFLVGYIEGAKYVDKNISVMSAYVGGFKDPAKAKELALIMYEKGSAVVFTVAGQSGLGTVDAAAEKAAFAIGVDSDQAALFMESDPAKAACIITSAVKNTSQYGSDAVKRFVDGKLTFGTKERLGFERGAVGIAKNSVYEASLSKESRDKIENIQKDLSEGKILVTDIAGLEKSAVEEIREKARP